jgi:hypothetical protein
VVKHVLQGVRCVVFDVGETLVNETRIWASIANECGVPMATVCGVLGGRIERGEHHGRLWDVLGVDRVVPHLLVVAGAGLCVAAVTLSPDAVAAPFITGGGYACILPTNVGRKTLSRSGVINRGKANPTRTRAMTPAVAMRSP